MHARGIEIIVQSQEEVGALLRFLFMGNAHMYVHMRVFLTRELANPTDMRSDFPPSVCVVSVKASFA